MTPLMPDPLETDEQHARYLHHDVAGLDELAVSFELRRLENALMTSHRAHHRVERLWLRQRHARLRARLDALRPPPSAPRRAARIDDEFRPRRRRGEWG